VEVLAAFVVGQRSGDLLVSDVKEVVDVECPDPNLAARA